MSQITLNIIAADGKIHGRPHASFANTIVAALSAEPETLDDLRAAIARFEHHDRDCFGGFYKGLDDEPYDAGICYIDLTARLVAYESTYSYLSSSGSVQYHDGQCATDISLPYHVSDDWKFVDWVDEFDAFAVGPRKKRAAQPPLDARKVLYGPRLAEFLVKECFAARGGTVGEDEAWTPPAGWAFRELAGRFEDGESPRVADAVAEIHARWLMTPRKDLNGCTPREILLEKQDHISWDMQDRCEAWTYLDKCPPPLSRDSHAYKYGGFGSHENYVYYEIVRFLAWECWERVVNGNPGDGPIEVLMANEAERLHALGLRWLDEPNAELSGVPAQIIENERRRIPEAGSGHDAMVDEDCPCCQAMADMPGPFFWHLDGCNNDDDFAFSFHATREEWEEERREWDEIDRRHEARKRDDLFYADAYDFDDDDEEDWTPPKFHFSTFDPDSVLAVMQFGYDLAELIAELQKSTETHLLAESLQRQFGNLRETIENKQRELREPVTDRFGEELLATAAARTDLAAKCEHLADQLTTLAKCGAFDGPRWTDVPF
jgi:hypothetical protein